MNYEEIGQKIREWAMQFYQYAMTQGENNFRIADPHILHGSNVPMDQLIYFFASFIVVLFTVIYSCDSVQILHPIDGIREWKYKISIIKVLGFSTAVFAFHTFYKMLVSILASFLWADASYAALKCLGSFINPFSIMAYAFAITTLTFRRGRLQAFMLGLLIFLTPAVMTTVGLSLENKSIYFSAISISILGAVLYQSALNTRLSPFMAGFVLDLAYFVAKYFMLYYSERVYLLSAGDNLGKIVQYMACIEVDLILALLFLLVLLIYRLATTENVKLKKEIAFPIILFIATLTSVYFGKVGFQYKPYYDHAVALWENGDYDGAVNEFMTLDGYKDSEEYIKEYRNWKNENIYNGGLLYMQEGSYELALEAFQQIRDYKDASDKIAECEWNLRNHLVGLWVGAAGSQLSLNPDGTCHYHDGGGVEGDGTWFTEERAVLRVDTDALGYQIYGSLPEGYETKTILFQADGSNWRDEEFVKQQ